jgi:ADP-heptose:LPS heptosyltransferase
MLMLWRRRLLPETEDPSVLWLRPASGFGDHLMLSAVIEGIKAERPELRFRLAVNHPELFAGNPHVEETLRLRLVRRRCPTRLGRYQYLVHRSPEERHLQTQGHLIDDLYRAIGVSLRRRPRDPRIYLTDRELNFRARVLERLPRPIVAVVTHGKARVNLPNKIYPPDQWAELAARLAREYPTVLQLGSREDGPGLSGCHDWRDLGLRRTASVLRRCDLLVCHVGGIMHLARAVGAPTVALYGAAEHPNISGYVENRNLYTPIECGPCWSRDPCSHWSCMRHLTPERVMDEIHVALERGRRGQLAGDGLHIIDGARILEAPTPA